MTTFTTAPTSDFLPYVLKLAPHCPLFIAEQEIRSAAAELCVKAHIWRDVQTFAFSEQGQVIPTPSNIASSIVSIRRVKLDGYTLEPVSFASDEAVDAGVGQARFFHQEHPGRIWVNPEQFGDLEVWASLKPDPLFDTLALTPNTSLATLKTLPAFMLDLHAETIAHGALARVLLMPGQVWTNPEMSQYYRKMFEDCCDTLQIKAAMGEQRAPLRTNNNWM